MCLGERRWNGPEEACRVRREACILHSPCTLMHARLPVHSRSLIYIPFQLSSFDSHVRYDYLEFVDEHGHKKKYDGKVGKDRWAIRDEFKGSVVHFSFYSDGSNNEWGYKFIVSLVGVV